MTHGRDGKGRPSGEVILQGTATKQRKDYYTSTICSYFRGPAVTVQRDSNAGKSRTIETFIRLMGSLQEASSSNEYHFMIFRLFTMLKLQLHNRILPRHSYMLTNTNHNYALAVFKYCFSVKWGTVLVASCL